MIEMYQGGVLGPTQVVDYSTTIMQAYPSVAVQREPFVGFKVLCKDRLASSTHPRVRLETIDRGLTQILPTTGCIVREATAQETPDKSGLWVITMPVPRSHVTKQLNNLSNVLRALEQGQIFVAGTYEVNVSGRCTNGETEAMLTSLCIPADYLNCMITPTNSPYKYGYTTRINDQFICYRTRWNFGMKPFSEVYRDMMTLSQVIAAMYH